MSDVNWSNRETRRLLRMLSDPMLLEKHPLVAALRDALQANSARDAMVWLIRQAIPGSGHADQLMRELIFRQDVDGIKSHRVAGMMGLSIRSYFRYRERAIEAISKALEHELQTDRQESQQIQFARLAAQFDAKTAYDLYSAAVPEPSGQIAYEIVRMAIGAGQPVTRHMIKRCGDPWRFLAVTAVARSHLAGGRPKLAGRWQRKLRSIALDPATPAGARAAFELAYLERLEALCRCDMPAAREAVERMKTYALGYGPLVGQALVIEAEQACDDGDSEKANQIFSELATINAVTRDPKVVARTADALSMLALMQMRWHEAIDNANFAALALEQVEPEFAMCVRTVAGRACVQLRHAWAPSAELCARYPTSWITGQALAVQSRIQCRVDAAVARETAQRAVGIATDQGALGSLCFAQASLAFALDGLKEFDEAQTLRVQAWESAVALGRQFYLHDMFVVPDMRDRDFGSFDLSDSFVDAIVRRGRALCDADGRAGAIKEPPFFATFLRHALVQCGRLSCRRRTAESFDAIRAAAPWRDSGFGAREGLTKVHQFGPLLARDLAWCVGFEDRAALRGRFLELFYSAAARCAATVEAAPDRPSGETSFLAS